MNFMPTSYSTKPPPNIAQSHRRRQAIPSAGSAENPASAAATAPGRLGEATSGMRVPSSASANKPGYAGRGRAGDMNDVRRRISEI